MRITKDKETRRAEFVEASLALFMEKGYTTTMISDIVRRVNVAQGTFYYYFPTKEDALDAVLERILQEAVDRARRLVADGEQTVVQRLEALFRMLFSPRGSMEANSPYSAFLSDPAVHAKLEQVRLRLLGPVLRELLDAGVTSGEFKALRFPPELSEIALLGVTGFMAGRRQWMRESPMAADATLEALAEFMERLLGLPDGSLDFKDKVIRRHL